LPWLITCKHPPIDQKLRGRYQGKRLTSAQGFPMAVETPICDFGWKAPDFSLPGVDGTTYTLENVKGEKGLLIIFMCNNVCT